MEKRIAHSFYGLGTFVFFLYFMKVSSAPTPNSSNFIDVMKNDKEMIPCDVPNYLYESDIVKECRNVVYPTDDQLHDDKDYLCLAFYNTLYKACQNNQFQNSSFNNTATFNLYIKKFFPGEEEDDRINFCESIKGIAFSNKKLKLLSTVNINKPNICYSVCFGMLGKFEPLCAILSWSKSIDNDIIQKNKVQQTETYSSALNTKNTNSVVKKPKTNVPSTEEIQNSKSVNVKTSDAPKVQEMPSIDEKISAQKDVDENTKQDVASNINPSPAKKQENIKANTDQVDDNLEKPRLLSNENPENLKQTENAKVNNADDDTERTKSNNMDAKITTISEHTQDDENPVNQDDLINDPNEADDQPNFTSDQGRLSSEQRNYGFNDSHYRTDEESHFFTYFTIISIISIAAYIGYHNKQKILAIVLEGRRTRNSRGRRTPRGSTANYHKLGTLEEAVTSQCNANVTHVIY